MQQKAADEKILIGLSGVAGSGKDTVGSMLIDAGDMVTHALASPLKEGVKRMFGFTDDQVYGSRKEEPVDGLGGLTPRRILQVLGTEGGRALHPDIWVWQAQREWREVLQMKGAGGMVVTDVRFENEADWIREAGGFIWHIRREERGDREGVPFHASEAGVNVKNGDLVMLNNGTIEDLRGQVEAAFEDCQANSALSRIKDYSLQGGL